MPVPFWKPSREYLKFKDEIDLAISGCLERGELTLGYYNDGGEEIGNFERRFAERIGVKHCIMTGAGTHALKVAYLALGLGVGDEVIVPSHTFIATIDQIAETGAVPVLVDIGEDGLMSIDRMIEAITPRTKAIVPVHLEGKMCDMERIMEVATKQGLFVIEDAAQAIGATQDNRHAGTIGNAGCFSFYPAKILGAIGNAGAVVTNDDDLAAQMRLIRSNCNIGKNKEINSVTSFGGNYEPDAIHAAVLNIKLNHLDEKLARRKEIADRYNQELEDIKGLILPTKQDGRSWQDYIIRTETEEDRDLLVMFLKNRGIGVLGTGLMPNHAYPNLKMIVRPVENTEKYLKTQIRIPCNPEVSDDEVSEVIEAIKAYPL